MRTAAFLALLVLPALAAAQSVPDIPVAPSSLNRTAADRQREQQAADADRRRAADLAQRDARTATQVSQRPANDASVGAGTSLSTPSSTGASISPPPPPPQS